MKDDRLKMNKVYLKFIFVIAVLNFGYGLFEYKNFQKSSGSYIEDGYNRNNQIFNSLLESEQKVVESIGISLANSMVTKEAFIKNNPLLLKDEFLKLKNMLNQKQLIHEIHFFKSNMVSFANISNNINLKENLATQFRPDVAWVLEHKKSSNNFQTCQTYSGIRSIQPIFDQENNLLGSVSVGTTVNQFPDKFIKQSTSDEVIFINKKEIFQNLKAQYLDKIIKNSDSFDEYIISPKTANLNLIQNINLDKKYSAIEFEDKIYMVNVFHFYNFMKESKYQMVVLKDITYLSTNFYTRLIEELFLLSLISIFLVYFMIFIKLDMNRKKIKTLSKLSQELHNQNFSPLKKFKVNRDSQDELDQLSCNIVEMGISLENFYKNLQIIIDEKSRETIINLYIDELTKLSNRRALEKFIKENRFQTLIFMDIDSFSEINDFFGTEIGNSVLIGVAEKLKLFGDRYGFKIYRVGSDEFAVLCIEEEKSKTFLETLISDFSNMNLKDIDRDVSINVDFTFGVSTGDKASIASSDIALHEAKNKKVRHIIYNNSLLSKDAHKKNIALSKQIRDAFEYDNFVLFYQPIYNKHREIVKYESLIRLKDGDKYLTPYHFLDYAKKTKAYFEITKIVVDKSFEKFKNIDISFSVNLSADDIVNPEIALYIEERVKEFPKPQNITFEILESEEIQQFDKILDFLNKVRALGVKIAIDDFGSGYSNFTYLLDIKPDYLKIDGSIIKGIATQKSSYLIAKSIVDFSKASNFTIIGEFIDSEDVFKKGKELGIDMFQGYYLSMPLKDI